MLVGWVTTWIYINLTLTLLFCSLNKTLTLNIGYLPEASLE